MFALSILQYNKCVYSSHWISCPKSKDTRHNSEGLGFNCASDYPQAPGSCSPDETLRLHLERSWEKELDTESRSIPEKMGWQ